MEVQKRVRDNSGRIYGTETKYACRAWFHSEGWIKKIEEQLPYPHLRAIDKALAFVHGLLCDARKLTDYFLHQTNRGICRPLRRFTEVRDSSWKAFWTIREFPLTKKDLLGIIREIPFTKSDGFGVIRKFPVQNLASSVPSGSSLREIWALPGAPGVTLYGRRALPDDPEDTLYAIWTFPDAPELLFPGKGLVRDSPEMLFTEKEYLPGFPRVLFTGKEHLGDHPEVPFTGKEQVREAPEVVFTGKGNFRNVRRSSLQKKSVSGIVREGPDCVKSNSRVIRKCSLRKKGTFGESKRAIYR